MTRTIDCRPLRVRRPFAVLLRRAGLFAGAAVICVLALAGLGALVTSPTSTRATAPMLVASSVQKPLPSLSESTPAANAPVDTNADPNVRPDGGLDYLGMKTEAEEKLRSVLTDDHDVRYRDIHTRLSTFEGGGIVAFCGEENSHTPLGGYGGFQRFVASRSVAVTEGQMSQSDFEQAWSQFCDNAVEGPRVWF